MGDPKESRRLRIVPASKLEADTALPPLPSPPMHLGQMLLFPDQPDDLLGATNPARLGDVALMRLLNELQPRWILDVRPVPFFNIGSLTRQRVFDLLTSFGGCYYSVEGRVRVDNPMGTGDAGWAPTLAQHITSVFTRKRLCSVGGPVLLLHNVRWEMEHTKIFAQHLRPEPRHGWRVKAL